MSRRIIIIGGPHTGKTTLAGRLQTELGIESVYHSTDDLMDLGWSEQSEAASKWFSEPGDWIVEGVSSARALRKWLKANPDVPLDAEILVVDKAFGPLKPGQVSMTKGIDTVFREIQPEVIKRGARVQKLKDANHAIDFSRLEQSDENPAMPEENAEAVPVALKRKLTKEEFEKLSDAQKELYKDPGNNGNYVLDAEPDEETEPLKTALEREKAAAAAAKKVADDLAAKYKDTDPEEYKLLKAAADEAAREGKKKDGDWEGWKKTFQDEKAISDQQFQATIKTLTERVNTFLLDNKIAQAALEAGVRKKLVPHVVSNTKQFFRLDQKEGIEVLDEQGNPINVTVDAFFKDRYVTEFPEYYEPTGNGGSGASNNGNSSRGGARVVSKTDQAALNANLEAIAKGEITVQE